MRKLFLLFLIIAAGVITSGAQTSTQNLGRCLADSTSGKDRKAFVRWVMVAMMQHPAMSDLVTVPKAKIEEVTNDAAAVFMRLIAVDCNKEMKLAMKSGAKAIEEAFGSLGIVAMDEAMNNPQVQSTMDDLVRRLDRSKLRQSLGDDYH